MYTGQTTRPTLHAAAAAAQLHSRIVLMIVSDEEYVGVRMQQSLESAECLLQHGRQRMIVGGAVEQGTHPANRH